MNILRSLPLVTLLALASGNALASSPTDVVRYDCKLPDSDRPAGGARTVVSASPDLVRTVLQDFEHYAYYFDPDKGRAFGIDAPWLDAAQADISEGISLLQAGFCDPKDPQPWARQAMEKFNKAFTEIATKKAI